MAGNRTIGARSRVLLVLGAGAAQLGLLEAAREAGCFTIAVDRDPLAPGFQVADRRAIVSTEDEPAIERLARAEDIGGVISPGSDWPVGVAARIAEKLRLAHPISAETAVLATSKMRQRERFAAAGVPQPRSVVCRDLAEAEAAVEEIGYPCVLKAPDRQGQKGLALVREPEELPAAVALALGAARAPLCLVEEAVAGPEITVNAFSVGGRFIPLTVTDRLVAEPPAFGGALAHVWPSEHAVEAAVDAARAAAEALDVLDGPSYTQLLLGPDGPRVGELAARLGGGHDAELCREALGVDLNALAVSAALGEELGPIEPSPQVGGAAMRFLVAP
ncbi:MAG: ATP-grasp domain-containing protein, partial [Gaiellaceae bacterium]